MKVILYAKNDFVREYNKVKVDKTFIKFLKDNEKLIKLIEITHIK